jgi:hypothetical protein
LELIIVFDQIVLQDPYDNIIDFASFWWFGKNQNSFLVGNCVYVGLLLIPRKKQNLTTPKTQPAAEMFGCSRMNTTESSCLLCCEALEAEKKNSEFGLSRPLSGQKTPNI